MRQLGINLVPNFLHFEANLLVGSYGLEVCPQYIQLGERHCR